jgi:hypothetical protein
MRKLGIIAVLSLMALAIAAVPALAAKPGTGSTSGNPHYVGPAPTILVDGNTATLSSGAKIAGIGSDPVTFLLTVQGFVTTTCSNPAGNVAPGQNSSFNLPGTPVTVDPDQTGTLTVPEGISASGPAVGTVLTQQQAGCPNRKWTGTVATSTITSAALTVTQGGVPIPSLAVTYP